MLSSMRIISWNIRAGGGGRSERIAAAIDGWQPDIVALSEFRATPASDWLAETLADIGLQHPLATADPSAPAVNALLLASRRPLTPAALRPQPQPKLRAMAAIVDEPKPLFVVAVHGPLGASSLRSPFNRRILRFLARWRGRPGVLVGDTNTGRRGVDEESPVFNAEDDAWMDGLHAAGWIDACRYFPR